MAEKVVPADKLEMIGEQFDRFEKEEIGQGTHEAFHEMIDRVFEDLPLGQSGSYPSSSYLSLNFQFHRKPTFR